LKDVREIMTKLGRRLSRYVVRGDGKEGLDSECNWNHLIPNFLKFVVW
jgi:hypothetical protein